MNPQCTIKNNFNSFKETLFLKGSNFYLSNFNLKLVRDDYLSWLRNKNTNKYLITARDDISIDQVKAYCSNLIVSDNNLFLALFFDETKKHIGNVRLGPIDIQSNVCQFSMMIGDPKFHGRGMGTEIVAVCIQFCFRQLGMEKVFLEVIDDNKSAVRIYEKNGLITEGLLKKHIKLDGCHYDLRIMSVFKGSV